MEFGKGVLNALPADYSQAEMEDAMLTIITVWNAIVLDTWHNTDKNENMVLDRLSANHRIQDRCLLDNV